MVGEAGIEPASPHGEWILSPSCMPIPPLAHAESISPETLKLQEFCASILVIAVPVIESSAASTVKIYP